MFCVKCGNVLGAAAKFCNICGNPARMPEAFAPYVGKKAKSSSKTVIVAVVAVVLASAVGLLLFFYAPLPFLTRGGSGDLDARIMSVFRVDGDAVSLQRARGATTDARVGMGLHDGYAVSTGRGTFCYISLDADSLVKMDVFTDISVGRLTDDLLRINIDGGQVLVNVQNQAPEHELEAIIGNTVISVRGTLFVAGVYAGGEAMIIVLDGSVYVNGVRLSAGYTMSMFDGARMDYVITPTVFGELDGFQLNAIIDNQSLLLAARVINENDLYEVRQLAGVRYVPATGGTPTDISAVSVGDIIQFGNYDWRVLDVRSDRALIITDMALEVRGRDHIRAHGQTWETCRYRIYLNNDFLIRFSYADRARILETNVVNSDNPWFGTSGGRDTVDRIFFLSVDEVLRYFGDSSLMAQGMDAGNRQAASIDAFSMDPTLEEFWGIWQGRNVHDRYSANRLAYGAQYVGGRIADYPAVWLLRTPGVEGFAVGIAPTNDNLTYVHSNGSIAMHGIVSTVAGIRPALWLCFGD